MSLRRIEGPAVAARSFRPAVPAVIDPDRREATRRAMLREREIAPEVLSVAVAHDDDAARALGREPPPRDRHPTVATERPLLRDHGALRTRATAAFQPRCSVSRTSAAIRG